MPLFVVVCILKLDIVIVVACVQRLRTLHLFRQLKKKTVANARGRANKHEKKSCTATCASARLFKIKH